jgi:hypothetical protein
MAALNLPRSMLEAGYNARQNAIANNADAAEYNRAMFMAPYNVLSALGITDFARGLFGGAPANAAPVNAAMVHTAPPAAAASVPAQPPRGAPVTPLTDESIKQYGALSPAARAVLGHVNPQAAMAAPQATPSLQQNPSLMQMLAGYAAGNGGKISLHAISALSDAALKGASASAATARGSTAPRIADIAGAQALKLGGELFNRQQAAAMAKGDNAAADKNVLAYRQLLLQLARARAVDPLDPSMTYDGVVP